MSWIDADELESFKRDLDLRSYAAAQGYRVDGLESWRGSTVMRNDAGDKVIIRRKPNGHYVYFSVRDDSDHGTIVDFIQRRKGLSLGEVRLEIRQWAGQHRPTISTFASLDSTIKDRAQVVAEYASMQDAPHHPYLARERGIPAAVLRSSRFAGRVRIDRRGNAIFPHFDRDGLCGYEMKNRGFTGFSAGGKKGLWFSRLHRDDNRLVFCESAIDALSYAFLFPDGRARYASIGGQVSPAQSELIEGAIAHMPHASEIVAAMDADEAGRKLAAIVHQSVDSAGRADLVFRNHVPDGAKDWNDALRLLNCNPRPVP